VFSCRHSKSSACVRSINWKIFFRVLLIYLDSTFISQRAYDATHETGFDGIADSLQLLECRLYGPVTGVDSS
jgi:hypothetical protein